jgi:hypothetical protein
MREEGEVATEAVLADGGRQVELIPTTENIVFFFTYSCNMPARAHIQKFLFGRS